MPPRRTAIALGLVCAIGLITALVLTSFTAPVGRPVGLVTRPSPIVGGSPGSPSTPPGPSPSTSRPGVKPTPKPPTKPSTKPSPPVTSITGASLGIPGAGTWKLPAWPSQSGMRWRGPYGSMGSTGTSSVALTFDDGPGPYTSRILDILDANHVKATFCLIGRQIHDYASVVKRMIDDGMTLCNHSWDHDESLGRHPAAYIAANLQRMLDAVHKVDPHATVAYFRQPGGNFTPVDVRVSELLGMRPLYWTEDTDDWKMPGAAAIEHSLLTRTHRDSIVLMHDAGGDRSQTLTAVTALLPELKDKYHLIALPNSRTVAVSRPGPAAPTPPAAPPSSPPPSAGSGYFAVVVPRPSRDPVR